MHLNEREFKKKKPFIILKIIKCQLSEIRKKIVIFTVCEIIIFRLCNTLLYYYF